MKLMTIGEVAKETGVSVPTIRYYEKRSLLEVPKRFESSGYRAFEQEAVRRIKFIKNAQSLGFTLEEIKRLLSLRGQSEASCSEVRDVAEQKLIEINEKIEKLKEIREGLESLTHLCPGDLSTDCPILEVMLLS